jgi:4-hydroxy-tetrahydrodipicolinate reductase
MDTTSTPVRIALVGYGSMGKELERLAPQYACTVEQIFTSKRPLSRIQASDMNFDVAIDFSLPGNVLDNVRFLAEHGKSVVLGTTGWMQHKDTLAAIVRESRIGLVWGTNFSVGVQIFSHLVRAAAEFAQRFDDYDVALHELHHTRKLDSPSGTALSLAALVQEALPRKTTLLPNTSHGRIAPEALHVSSTRLGETPGTHTFYLDSLPDTIELTHRARNRSGFAIGALRTARWLQDKQGMMEFSEVFPQLHI